MLVPESFIQDCKITKWEGGTYEDVAILAEARKKDTEACNLDKVAIRRWQAESIKLYQTKP